ncbi:unnamed protein product, partial [Meganyctiphanes norvegica]
MDDDEKDGKEYRWESGYEKTWEAIQEDDSGRLEASITEMIQRAKRRRLMEREASVRLGIMRHIFIVLDLSHPMSMQDMKPTRQLCVLKVNTKIGGTMLDATFYGDLTINPAQYERNRRFGHLVHALGRATSGAKLPSAGLCLNASKAESHLDSATISPHARGPRRHDLRTSRGVHIFFAGLRIC